MALAAPHVVLAELLGPHLWGGFEVLPAISGKLVVDVTVPLYPRPVRVELALDVGLFHRLTFGELEDRVAEMVEELFEYLLWSREAAGGA